ncbi:MAG TPA: nucleoside deaminase [Firmicutes bacterium]|jgi:tRNA(adenine34) deaminase|nr:nucleoside deaminase [Bacillota bacterium]
MEQTDGYFMQEALQEAEKAMALEEVPIGAVVVYEGEIYARGYNLRERASDPTAHAEIIALRAAAARRGSWRLHGMTLYVTLEPCPMCAGAMVNARLERLVFGAFDPKGGAAGSLMNLLCDERLNHRLAVTGGVLADEASRLLKEFFQRKREFTD